MEEKTPLLKEASPESHMEVLQEVTLVPLEAQTIPISNNENASAFLPCVTELVSFESETNQNSRPSILQSTSSATKSKNEADSTTSQATSPSAEPNQDTSQSYLSTTETNQDAGLSTSSAILPNQVAGPSTSSAVLWSQGAGPSVSSTTERNGTLELILSAPEIHRSITQECASALDDEQLTENDPLLPPDPPDYHDIIPLYDDGSNIPPPPPSIFNSLFCCFFGAYHLYYARKIRNSKMITFFRNTPVFDDPADPLYCPELVHEYIFYMNFVVPAIGISALLLHLPMKPVDNMRRILEAAAERDTLRQQRNIEDDPNLPQVYTAWVKPRRRRSRLNADNSEGNDPRLGLNEGTEDHDSRSRSNEEHIAIPASSSEETTIGTTVGGGDMRVRWWDEASPDTRNDSGDEEGTVGGPISGQVWDEEGAVGGQTFFQEYDIIGAVDSHWGHEEGAVGGDIGDGAECGGYRTLLWEEGEGLDTPPRNRSSTFTIHRGEETPAGDFSASSRWNEAHDDLRSQWLEELSKCGARPKSRETKEGGVRPKRNEGDQEDVNPLQAESTETEVKVESDAVLTKWHEYGARPKIKEKVEGVPKIKSKAGTEGDAKSKSKRSTNESALPNRVVRAEVADKILRNNKDAEMDAFGNQCSVGNEGDIRPKEDAESGARPKRKGNTDVKPKKGTETDTGPKMKENSGVKMEEPTEGGDLPKSEESIKSDFTPKITESTESSDSK